ncbi:MAG: MarR family transcriptional regulator [Erythrobacter sp.]|jgi:DNA-binding MarR family transcriptional regulator|nr:MarR family transcriptional regulator [Erythrobacter sp.]
MSADEKQVLRLWIELLGRSNAIKKDLDARLRAEFGQSLSRFDLLSALHRAGPEGLRASELSQFLLVTDGATSQLTPPLIREELLEREPCPNDRRSVVFRLTPQGSALFERMAQSHREWVCERFEDFSEEEVGTLLALARRIEAPLSRAAKERSAA